MRHPWSRMWARYPLWKWSYAVAAAAVLAFMLIGNLIRLRGDASIRGPDMILHLNNSVAFYRLWHDAAHDPAASWCGRCCNLASLLSRRLSSTDDRHPNLVFAVTAVCYSLFGQTLGAAKSSNWVYLLLLLWSVYALGRCVSGRLTGLIAASLVCMYPAIFESSRQYGLDFPLTAMVALSMVLLLKSDGFADRRYSFLLGLAVGVGMLVKLQMLVYVALPFGALLAAAFAQARRQDSGGRAPLAPRLINVGIVMASAAIVSSIWWGGRLGAIWRIVHMHMTEPDLSPAMGHCYGAVALHILQSMVFDPLGLPLFAASVAALACLLASRAEQRFVLGAWAVSQFVMLTLLLPVRINGTYPAAELRCGMPVVPALAVITSWWVCRLKDMTTRTVIFASLLGFACLQFGVRTFAPPDGGRAAPSWRGGPNLERMGLPRIRGIMSDPLALLGETPYGAPKQNAAALHIDKLMERMHEYILPKMKASALCVSLSRRPFSHEGMLTYYMNNRYANMTVYMVGQLIFSDGPRILKDLDFIIVYASRDIGSWPEIERDLTQGGAADPEPLPNLDREPQDLWRSPRGLELLGKLSRQMGQFELILEQPLPFGRHWLLYKRRSLWGAGA
ncbi:MAG: glycosyltransferase family 39 protein [Elusimicrobia bacterium]|nr:glycosyltransferase family 39 protein [Elusimicrobiota bacterium]